MSCRVTIFIVEQVIGRVAPCPPWSRTLPFVEPFLGARALELPERRDQ